MVLSVPGEYPRIQGFLFSIRNIIDLSIKHECDERSVLDAADLFMQKALFLAVGRVLVLCRRPSPRKWNAPGTAGYGPGADGS